MKKSISNYISGVRIILSPFAYYAGFVQEKELFVTLLLLGGLTDVLDGYLARLLKIESHWGNVIDTIADVLFYPTFLMLYFFVPEVIKENVLVIVAVGLLFALSVVIGAARRNLQLPHVFSSKCAAVLRYAFILYTLLISYSHAFFYVTAAVSAWAAFEQVIIASGRRKKAE